MHIYILYIDTYIYIYIYTQINICTDVTYISKYTTNILDYQRMYVRNTYLVHTYMHACMHACMHAYMIMHTFLPHARV